MRNLSRRTYLVSTGIAVTGAVGLSGCLGANGASGALATQVTDQPGDIADFESCVVTLVGVWLGPEDDPDDEDDGSTEREYIKFDESRTADLVELQDGEVQLVDETELDSGEFEFLQLDVDDIDATLSDEESADVEVPGDAPLTFNEPFEIREDTRTVFTADFTPVQKGQGGGYLLQPVPDGITVEYEDL